MEQILLDVLSDLKEIKFHLQDNTTRIVKNEMALESIDKSIGQIESYKERIIKLEGSMHYLNTTLDKTNSTLEKLDSTVDGVKDVLTTQRGSAKTVGYAWEIIKWLGVAAIVPALKGLIDYYSK